MNLDHNWILIFPLQEGRNEGHVPTESNFSMACRYIKYFCELNLLIRATFETFWIQEKMLLKKCWKDETAFIEVLGFGAFCGTHPGNEGYYLN